jgi:hypothetical protein
MQRNSKVLKTHSGKQVLGTFAVHRLFGASLIQPNVAYLAATSLIWLQRRLFGRGIAYSAAEYAMMTQLATG